MFDFQLIAERLIKREKAIKVEIKDKQVKWELQSSAMDC